MLFRFLAWGEETDNGAILNVCNLQNEKYICKKITNSE